MPGINNLNFIFNPGSVAIVGISTNKTALNLGQVIYLDSLLSAGFVGPIYPVNPKGGEVCERKVYPNVKDIPGTVDYVICCAAANTTPRLVKDCITRGVKAIQFFTSGFSETGTEEGKRLEAEICSLAQQSGIRLIGPNCMGVYCPETGMSFAADFPKESGGVSFICQSGGNAMYFVRMATQRGIRFSKVVSYGNACDVNESDLLEYFMADPDTEIILLYVEGAKDGRRFRRVLQEAAEAKPVIVLKGGYTEAGARAASSHTGALAAPAKVWDGLIRQTGAIPASSLEEMADLVVTIQCLPVPDGGRIGTMGIGGGATVIAADVYAANGLVLPPFPGELQQKLSGLVPRTAGLSLNNPVDISGGSHVNAALYDVGKALAEYDGIDVLVFHLPLSIVSLFFAYTEKVMSSYIDAIVRVSREAKKPIAVVLYNSPNGEVWQLAFRCQKKCYEAGIPAYFSIENAARALSQYVEHSLSRAKSTDRLQTGVIN